MLGPSPSREVLAGVARPLAAKGAAVVKHKRKAWLATFDPVTDRFEQIDESTDSWELPFAAPADSTDADCDFI